MPGGRWLGYVGAYGCLAIFIALMWVVYYVGTRDGSIVIEQGEYNYDEEDEEFLFGSNPSGGGGGGGVSAGGKTIRAPERISKSTRRHPFAETFPREAMVVDSNVVLGNLAGNVTQLAPISYNQQRPSIRSISQKVSPFSSKVLASETTSKGHPQSPPPPPPPSSSSNG